MNEEELARRQAFIKALVKFQGMVPCIGKTQAAGRGGFAYKYAGLDTIHAAIQGPLCECGLAVFFSTDTSESGFVVSCEIMHVDGYSKASTFEVAIDPQARMNLAQKAGSALTYGRRYALCAALGLVMAEEDDDAHAVGKPQQTHESQSGWNGMPADYRPPTPPRKISDAQKRRLEARISKSHSSREAVKNFMMKEWGVETFLDLDQEQYEVLDKIIEEKLQKAVQAQ